MHFTYIIYVYNGVILYNNYIMSHVINRVQFDGRLTADPIIKTTQNGITMAIINVIQNKKYKNKSGEIIENVTCLQFVAYGSTATFIQKYLTKGNAVYVEAGISTWDTIKDDKKVYGTTYTIDFIKNNTWAKNTSVTREDVEDIMSEEF